MRPKLQDSYDNALFVPGHEAGILRSLPAGPALLAIFAAQIATIYAGPPLFGLFSVVLLTGCAIGRRPVHRILLRAWPVLILAALTAWRQTDDFSWGTLLVFLRFCWMILAADLYVSSFGWQPMLARTATGRKAHRGTPLSAVLRGTLRGTALTVWLTILQMTGILQALRNRRLAARARGVKRYRMLSPGALSSLIVTLVHDADLRAEAVQARGIRGDESGLPQAGS
ncbi:MAG: hypothetical protein ACOCRN_02695 [Spirochaetia bacterium]